MLAEPQSLTGFIVAPRRVTGIVCVTSGKQDYRDRGPQCRQLGRQRQPVNVAVRIAAPSLSMANSFRCWSLSGMHDGTISHATVSPPSDDDDRSVVNFWCLW
ncbi:hypothetical protein TIFTF001_002256 [Ficus carica]|uniref:Uncharacterized protein n=1 Tax=Ficus carica TaxID=3494 RepID=A0AA87ZM07_FICCA|nr:hypothetical protein TIFTF001_002256 [Ficus carica]